MKAVGLLGLVLVYPDPKGMHNAHGAHSNMYLGQVIISPLSIYTVRQDNGLFPIYQLITAYLLINGNPTGMWNCMRDCDVTLKEICYFC